MARPLIVTPARTAPSRTWLGKAPLLLRPSPETSILARPLKPLPASSARDRISASPIAVLPPAPKVAGSAASTRAAKSSAEARSVSRRHATAVSCTPAQTTRATATPRGSAVMASITSGSWNAAASPSRWRASSAPSTLLETSTASTSSMSTGSPARAADGARAAATAAIAARLAFPPMCFSPRWARSDPRVRVPHHNAAATGMATGGSDA